MSRRFATQQQAARYLGCTDRTIRNKIAEGVLTGYRVPGSRAIRVDLNQIDQLMTAMPAAFKPKNPFGPRAKIVDLSNVVSPISGLNVPEVVTDGGNER